MSNESTKRYGRNPDGTYSICKAKPGNEGRYGCHHVASKDGSEPAHELLSKAEAQALNEKVYERNTAGKLNKSRTDLNKKWNPTLPVSAPTASLPSDEDLAHEKEEKTIELDHASELSRRASLSDVIEVNGHDVRDYGPLEINNGRKYVTVKSARDPSKEAIQIPLDDHISFKRRQTTKRAFRARFRLDYEDATNEHDDAVKKNLYDSSNAIRASIINGQLLNESKVNTMNESRIISDFANNVNAYAKKSGLNKYGATVGVLSGPAADSILTSPAEDPYDTVEAVRNASYLDEVNRVVSGLGDPSALSAGEITEELESERNRVNTQLQIHAKNMETMDPDTNDINQYIMQSTYARTLNNIHQVVTSRKDYKPEYIGRVIRNELEMNGTWIYETNRDNNLDRAFDNNTSAAARAQNNAEISAHARVAAILMKNGEFEK
jgi:hypothetical protein